MFDQSAASGPADLLPEHKKLIIYKSDTRILPVFQRVGYGSIKNKK